jgi:hypothetical protein
MAASTRVLAQRVHTAFSANGPLLAALSSLFPLPPALKLPEIAPDTPPSRVRPIFASFVLPSNTDSLSCAG